MKKLCVLLACFLCVSCKTITKVEYRDRYVDNNTTQIKHDTIKEFKTDSIYLEVVQRGDTIYQTKYKEITRWRDRIVERFDTCYKDSVITEYKESVKEVRYVPKIYKVSMCISILLLIFAIIKLVLWLRTKHII